MKEDAQDFFYPKEGRSVLAVQLLPVPLPAAVQGAALLKQKTPDWVNAAAVDGRIQLSKQPDSNLAHLWVETPDGGQVVRPNEWLVNLEGELFPLSDKVFRHIFLEKTLGVNNDTRH